MYQRSISLYELTMNEWIEEYKNCYEDVMNQNRNFIRLCNIQLIQEVLLWEQNNVKDPAFRHAINTIKYEYNIYKHQFESQSCFINFDNINQLIYGSSYEDLSAMSALWYLSDNVRIMFTKTLLIQIYPDIGELTLDVNPSTDYNQEIQYNLEGLNNMFVGLEKTLEQLSEMVFRNSDESYIDIEVSDNDENNKEKVYVNLYNELLSSITYMFNNIATVYSNLFYLLTKPFISSAPPTHRSGMVMSFHAVREQIHTYVDKHYMFRETIQGDILNTYNEYKPYSYKDERTQPHLQLASKIIDLEINIIDLEYVYYEYYKEYLLFNKYGNMIFSMFKYFERVMEYKTIYMSLNSLHRHKITKHDVKDITNIISLGTNVISIKDASIEPYKYYNSMGDYVYNLITVNQISKYKSSFLYLAPLLPLDIVHNNVSAYKKRHSISEQQLRELNLLGMIKILDISERKRYVIEHNPLGRDRIILDARSKVTKLKSFARECDKHIAERSINKLKWT